MVVDTLGIVCASLLTRREVYHTEDVACGGLHNHSHAKRCLLRDKGIAQTLGGHLLQAGIDGSNDIAAIFRHTVALVIDSGPETVGYALLNSQAIVAREVFIVYKLQTRASAGVALDNEHTITADNLTSKVVRGVDALIDTLTAVYNAHILVEDGELSLHHIPLIGGYRAREYFEGSWRTLLLLCDIRVEDVAVLLLRDIVVALTLGIRNGEVLSKELCQRVYIRLEVLRLGIAETLRSEVKGSLIAYTR